MGLPSINVGDVQTGAGDEVTLQLFTDGSALSNQLVGFAKYYSQGHPNVKVDIQD